MERVKSKRFDGLYFSLMMLVFFGLGTAAVMREAVWGVFLGEFLVFLLAEVLPFCRGRECLWVCVLTAMVWTPWEIRNGVKYTDMFWSGYSGWFSVVILIQVIIIFLCADVLIFGLLSRVFWKRQKPHCQK